MRKLILGIFCIVLIGCSGDDSTENELEALKKSIESTEQEIELFVNRSFGNSITDCRRKFIKGGDSCGPIITYGVKGIDTLELERLFDNLYTLKSELWKKQNEKVVCSVAFPDKDTLIAGKCLSCYGNKDHGYQCF